MTIDKPIAESDFFRVAGGIVLPSVLALRAYLRMIPDHELQEHVSVGKNDFAAWLEHVFAEPDLAAKLRRCKNREEMVWVLDDAFAELRMARVLKDDPVVEPRIVHVQNEPSQADPIALRDDINFRDPSQDIVTSNERISKRYEDVARDLQNALKDTMTKEFEQELERLKTRRDELAARISEARKTGKEMLIPSLLLRQFTPKLAYARASRDPKDLTIVETVLSETDAEFQQALQEQPVDVKADVLKLVGQSVPTKGGETSQSGNTYKRSMQEQSTR